MFPLSYSENELNKLLYFRPIEIYFEDSPPHFKYLNISKISKKEHQIVTDQLEREVSRIKNLDKATKKTRKSYKRYKFLKKRNMRDSMEKKYSRIIDFYLFQEKLNYLEIANATKASVIQLRKY